MVTCLLGVGSSSAQSYPFALKKGIYKFPALFANNVMGITSVWAKIYDARDAGRDNDSATYTSSFKETYLDNQILHGTFHGNSVGVHYDSVGYCTGLAKVLVGKRRYSLQDALAKGLLIITDSCVADTTHPRRQEWFNYTFRNTSAEEMTLVLATNTLIMSRKDTSEISPLDQDGFKLEKGHFATDNYWRRKPYYSWWYSVFYEDSNQFLTTIDSTGRSAALLEKYGMFKMGVYFDTDTYVRNRNGYLQLHGYGTIEPAHNDSGFLVYLRDKELMNAINKEGSYKIAWAGYREQKDGLPYYIIDTGGYGRPIEYKTMKEAINMLDHWTTKTVLVLATPAWTQMELYLLPDNAPALTTDYPKRIVYQRLYENGNCLNEFRQRTQIEDNESYDDVSPAVSGLQSFFDKKPENVNIDFNYRQYKYKHNMHRDKRYKYEVVATYTSGGMQHTFRAKLYSGQYDKATNDYIQFMATHMQQKLGIVDKSIADIYYMARYEAHKTLGNATDALYTHLILSETMMDE